MAPDAVRRIHAGMLEKWRGAMDLVGPGPLEPHLDDAEAVARLLQPSGHWADLGSGAGFPGVALAAAHPAARVTLVESRQKRATFLRLLVRATGLPNLDVVHGRVEDLDGASLDGVVSRAFAAPPVFLAHARRLLRPGGLAASLLAREETPSLEGLEVLHEAPYTVEDRARRVVVFRRLA